eukprot:354463-Chlamydomonas_euryale.AAC.15
MEGGGPLGACRCCRAVPDAAARVIGRRSNMDSEGYDVPPRRAAVLRPRQRVAAGGELEAVCGIAVCVPKVRTRQQAPHLRLHVPLDRRVRPTVLGWPGPRSVPPASDRRSTPARSSHAPQPDSVSSTFTVTTQRVNASQRAGGRNSASSPFQQEVQESSGPRLAGTSHGLAGGVQAWPWQGERNVRLRAHALAAMENARRQVC